MDTMFKKIFLFKCEIATFWFLASQHYYFSIAPGMAPMGQLFGFLQVNIIILALLLAWPLWDKCHEEIVYFINGVRPACLRLSLHVYWLLLLTIS